MFYTFFTSLLCLVNLLVVMAAALLWHWTRRQMTALRTRLEVVESALAQGHAPAPLIDPQPPAVTQVYAEEPRPVVERTPPVMEVTAEAARVSPIPDVQTAVALPVAPTPAPWTQHPLVAWFVRVHLMVQVGMVVLFFGVGFLVKYAVDQGWFPLELRLSAAALLGVGLAAIGWRVRQRQRTYGLALIGGGIGIVYLTTFGAYFFYGLLPALLAFTLFVLLALAYALMAIWNNAPILAFLAIVGAFLAPLLTADESGNHLVLFSYYAVVNAGVLAIAWYKQWPGLNLVSFVFSLLAATGWAFTAYEPAYFASTELFLALFFGFYLTISFWDALRTVGPKADGTQAESRVVAVLLLFANPLATFALQSALVAERSYWLAYTAFTLAALYALLGLFCQRRQVATFFTQAFFFFAGFFLLIGIPLRFDPRVTAALWAVQGLGQLWIGVRRQRTWPQLWGTLVQLLAGGAFSLHLLATPLLNLAPFLNHLYLGGLILSMAAILSATIVHRQPREVRARRPGLASGLLLLGLFWWYAGGVGQFALYAERSDRLAILLLFIGVSGVLGEWYGTAVQWRAPRFTLLTVLPAAAFVALYMFAWQFHPFAYGWYVWPVLLAVHLVQIWCHPRLAVYHAGGVWLATFLLTWWAVQQAAMYGFTGAWAGIACLIVPTVVLLLIGVFYTRLGWPLAAHPYAYAVLAALPIAVVLLAATLWVNQTNPGASTPVPFVPFLNPLDLMLVSVIVVCWQWSRRLRTLLSAAQVTVVSALSQWSVWLVSLWVFTLALARALHHLNGVPFTFTALYNSAIVQTTYALVWGLLALALMYLAHHRHWRHVWAIGATLLGITIIKLFLVDLAQTGSLARIISFIGVGLLTITVAYFWPAPPREEHRLKADGV